jgi:pimeloyl-ACP methyl ester carboxylesterase
MPMTPARVRPVDRVGHLRRPTLFVFAEHDCWVSPEAQARYRAALPPQARLNLLRGRSHGGHLDAAWAERAAEFLASTL